MVIPHPDDRTDLMMVTARVEKRLRLGDDGGGRAAEDSTKAAHAHEHSDNRDDKTQCDKEDNSTDEEERQRG